MVDTHDLFKKLGFGAKFNLKRFKEDAEKFQILPSTKKLNNSNGITFEALDFFGTNSKKNVIESNEKNDSLLVSLKDVNTGKKKKRKKRESTEDLHLENGSGIDIMSNHTHTEDLNLENGIDIDIMSNHTNTGKKKKKKKRESIEDLHLENGLDIDIISKDRNTEDLHLENGIDIDIMSNHTNTGKKKKRKKIEPAEDSHLENDGDTDIMSNHTNTDKKKKRKKRESVEDLHLENDNDTDIMSNHTYTDKKKKKKRETSEDLHLENGSDIDIMNNHTNTDKKKKRKIIESAEDLHLENENDIEIMTNHTKKVRTKHKTTITKEQLKQEHIEKVNLFRKEHRIYIHGEDVPDPIRIFSDLQKRVSNTILKNIENNGYTDPTPIQMQVLSVMLQNRELLACAPTGSGKTLAFIIPLLHHLKEPGKNGFRAVILSPTRELALQIHREFTRMNVGIGLKIHALLKSKSNNFGPKSSKAFDILIATPNRLVHMLSQDPPLVELDKVEWLVLDEGDKLFEDGSTGFRDQVATVYKACDNPSVKHALFSATLANNVEEWCKIHLDNVVRITVGTRNSAADTVKQELLFVGQESGKLLALRQIIQRGFQPPVLVFVQSKDRAKELFNELIYDGLNVDVIHADRTQAQRENTVKSFRTGKIWILIATELMGRGIDFKGVNVVVNYDFPPSAVSYIHRVGRTGRAGREGKAITMFTEDDVINLRSIANVMKSSGCDIPQWILQIKKPNRNMQKKLSKVPLKRENIKTASKFDQERVKRRKQMIEMSKAKNKSSS